MDAAAITSPASAGQQKLVRAPAWLGFAVPSPVWPGAAD
jgi:hypothetical protein